MTIHRDVIGCDIAKAHLDFFDKSTGRFWQTTNSPAMAGELAKSLVGRDCLVVFEATGHYDRVLRHALAEHGIAHVRANPEQARHFAKASGRRAKTDRIDARMLADLGSRMILREEPALDLARERLARLTTRRDQLVAVRKQERTRVHGEDDEFLLASLKAHIAWLDAEITRIEKTIAQTVKVEPEMAKIEALLRSAPGIGPTTAAILIGQLPELGHRSPKTIAALAGLAPYNNDSGAFSGKRSVRGGRTRIRQALYIAAVSIARSSGKITDFYKRLREAGKPAKLALIATARKLLTTLNAIARTQKPFLAT